MSLRTTKSPRHSLRAAFDLLPDAVFCIDRQSMMFTDINRAACLSLGYTREELLGTGPRQICPEADMAALEERLDAVPVDESVSVVVRTQQWRKDGRSVPVEWHVSRVREADTEQWIVVARELFMDERGATSHELGTLGHDPLTGLPDRRLFERRLNRTLERAREYDDYRFAVCFIDMDNFKAINDNVGHMVGDRVLCETARRLVSCVRPGDMVARFGGDEFTVLIDDLHNSEDAALVAQRILAHLEEPILINGQTVTVAASIGVAASSRSQRRIEDLLHDADRAMYRAKALGGGHLMICEDESSPHPPKPR